MPVRGDKSFEALALPHLEAVFRMARRLCRSEHEAEDIVQETFLRAFKAFDGFEMREFGMKPWLLRILHNTFLNRAKRESLAPRPADHETLEQHRSDSAGMPVEPPEIDYEHLDEEVKRAIDGLAPEFRSVVLLWGTMELSYREIAETLEVPIGTVMSRLHRARAQLVAALSDFARQHRVAISEGQS
ncbi:MAG: ECF RNA polymerase sigma factor SigR [Phycisphaerae bacterium]|nr:ECF RNA polymerase sigma factor SigR [Phycisphaerae bacterium]